MVEGQNERKKWNETALSLMAGQCVYAGGISGLYCQVNTQSQEFDGL